MQTTETLLYLIGICRVPVAVSKFYHHLPQTTVIFGTHGSLAQPAFEDKDNIIKR